MYLDDLLKFDREYVPAALDYAALLKWFQVNKLEQFLAGKSLEKMIKWQEIFYQKFYGKKFRIDRSKIFVDARRLPAIKMGLEVGCLNYAMLKIVPEEEILMIGGGGLSCECIHNDLFEKIISIENLLLAWREFSNGKLKKDDVLKFRSRLENNIFQLHCELKNKTYQHSDYTAFNVYDPKLRRIHKATVRDRVLHHAVFRILYPIFDSNFICDSYSCRVDKGAHRAVNRLETFLRKESKNNHKNIFALKCDVREFFDSVDQDILLKIIKRNISSNGLLWLLEKIIKSFPSGLPLGNVTSQLFANIYLNELDQFVKHELKKKYYLRYCDDFIILGENKEHLENLILHIDEFLQNKLGLYLHPNKIIIRKYVQGIDFLGYVVLPHYRVLRTKTKRRILRKIHKKYDNLKQESAYEESMDPSLRSYFGVLKHCSGYKIKTN